TFQTRWDARRFLLGLAIAFTAAGRGIAGIVESLQHHSRGGLDEWLLLPTLAVPLLLIGQLLFIGPVRRALGGRRTSFALLSRRGIRAAVDVARTGPKGSPAAPAGFPQLFTNRNSAHLFILGTALIP